MAVNQKDKNEMVAFIETHCNRAQKISNDLLRAPEAACILETLTVLAGCTLDPSLRSGDPDEQFVYLKHPDSFKASLYQVINAVSDAFRTGHNSVTKMQVNLDDMPTFMNDIMEAMENLSDPDSKELIDYALARIKNSSAKCVEASQEATDQAKHALEVIRELLGSAKATQGRKENRDKEIETEKAEQERVKKQRETALKDLKEVIEKQEKIVEEAMQDYKEKMVQSSDMTAQLAVMLMDSFSTIVETATASLKDATGFVKFAPGHLIASIQDRVSSTSHLKKDDVAAEAWEKTLLNLLENIVAEEQFDSENIESHANNLKAILKYKFPTDTGKMMEKSAKDLCKAFSSEDMKVVKQEVNNVKMTVETVQNIHSSKSEAGERKLQHEAMRSQERQSLMQAQQKNLEVARATMKEERELAEKLRKERAAADEKLNEAINAMERLNLEQVDLKDVLKYLQAGVAQLVEFQTAWENVNQFFKEVQIIVDGPLVKNIDGFTELVTNNKDKEKVGPLIRKKMLREAAKACAVGSVLMNTAALYKEISSTFVLPSVEQAVKNMALTREEAQIRQRSISSNFNKIKGAVKDTIESHNGRLPTAVKDSLESQGLTIKLAIEGSKN